jgi:hypothetical protein
MMGIYHMIYVKMIPWKRCCKNPWMSKVNNYIVKADIHGQGHTWVRYKISYKSTHGYCNY